MGVSGPQNLGKGELMLKDVTVPFPRGGMCRGSIWDGAWSTWPLAPLPPPPSARAPVSWQADQHKGNETVKEELINLHLLEEKASGLQIFHRLKIRRLDHVDPWEEEAGGGRGKLDPDSNLIIWIATQNISNDFQGCVCVVFLRVNGNPLKRRWQFKQVPINDIWHLLIQAHVKNAEKYLKTSPLKLKFTPDWDPAGDEFSRAATAFKVVIITTWVRWVGEMFTNWRKCFDL